MVDPALREEQESAAPEEGGVVDPTVSQWQLLQQICQRQLAEAVIQRYHAKLRCFLQSRVYTESDADDILQDVCVKISNSPKLAMVNKLDSYVFTIAMNTLRDKYRSAANREAGLAVPLESLEITDDAANPEDILEGLHTLKGVHQKVDSLPPRCKQAFLMRSVEGKPYKAIAKQMGISVSMVEKYVGRGLQALRHA